MFFLDTYKQSLSRVWAKCVDYSLPYYTQKNILGPDYVTNT